MYEEVTAAATLLSLRWGIMELKVESTKTTKFSSVSVALSKTAVNVMKKSTQGRSLTRIMLYKTSKCVVFAGHCS